MSGITPVSLDSMIALNRTPQANTTANSGADKSAIEKAFVALLMENMNLISMGSIDGNHHVAKDANLLIEQVFKDWLIEQDLGLGHQTIDKSEV